MKNLAELKSECAALGITIRTEGRPSKEPYIAALRDYLWQRDHPNESLPPQVRPMLLGDWNDLRAEQARQIENGTPGWIVQQKLDGVRALVHVESGQVRITSRCVSEVTYRLGEFEANVPHLTSGFSNLDGTILDGELVFHGSNLDTGQTVALHPLQAATVILSTSPDRAKLLQIRPENRLRFHAFDILKFRGDDLTTQPLRIRLDSLAQAMGAVDNPYVEAVPSFSIGRPAVHARILAAGGEGTVWKRLDQPYEPGRRVGHWLKRKREIVIEAFVSNAKPGSPGAGNSHLIGAVEFSVSEPAGQTRPVAWVSNWSDTERRAMTRYDAANGVGLHCSYLHRPAVIVGHEYSAKAGRFRHARLLRWLDR